MGEQDIFRAGSPGNAITGRVGVVEARRDKPGDPAGREWMQRAHHGRYYANAQNLARTARAAYDRVLTDRDLL